MDQQQPIEAAPSGAPAIVPTQRRVAVDRAPRAVPREPQPVAARDGIEARDWRVLPEKHRMMKEDCTVDVEATLWNGERQRATLEKRFGAGGGEMRPATADEYKLDVAEHLRPLAEAALDPETVSAFRSEVHEQGLTQGQYNWLMEKCLTIAPKLVEGGKKFDQGKAIAELRTTWPVEADFSKNVDRANGAMRGYGGDDAEGIFHDYGNDARIVLMMAKIGAEMGEDRAPASVGQPRGVGTVNELMRHPAYADPKHPEHERVSAQVRDFYQRSAG